MESDDRRADLQVRSVRTSTSGRGEHEQPAPGSGDPDAADLEVRPPDDVPENPEADAPWETEPPAAVIRRIKRTAVAAYLVFVPISLVLAGIRGLIALTCASAVTIIAFLWLEEIVEIVLQPAPSVRPWRLFLRSMARFALLGVALTVTIKVARFNAVSVLMGFSIIVVGICGEALYSLYRSLAQQR